MRGGGIQNKGSRKGHALVTSHAFSCYSRATNATFKVLVATSSQDLTLQGLEYSHQSSKILESWPFFSPRNQHFVLPNYEHTNLQILRVH